MGDSVTSNRVNCEESLQITILAIKSRKLLQYILYANYNMYLHQRTSSLCVSCCDFCMQKEFKLKGDYLLLHLPVLWAYFIAGPWVVLSPVSTCENAGRKCCESYFNPLCLPHQVNSTFKTGRDLKESFNSH